jgi:Ca2+/H+ antiporter
MMRLFYCLLLVSFQSYALDLGQITDNMMGPIMVIAKIMADVSVAVGVGLLIGSVLQYAAYRRNPSQVRLTTPIFLVIMGIILIAIPFVVHYYSGYVAPLPGI